MTIFDYGHTFTVAKVFFGFIFAQDKIYLSILGQTPAPLLYFVT